MKQVIGQQGEVVIIKIDRIPECNSKPAERIEAGVILSHSEQGHHHVLTGGDVVERVQDVPDGLQIFYAAIANAERVRQDAAVPHDAIELPPGNYEFRISREWDPFGEQARRVAD